jgi:dienelactone hydrolase
MNSLEYIQGLIKDMEPVMGYKEGCNLEEWQVMAHEKLTELLGLPFVECDDCFTVLSEEKGLEYTSIVFEFQSEPGYFVEATLLVPNGHTEAIPGVICLQGHSNGAHISLGIAKFEEDEEDIAGGRDFAVRAVKEGFCGIAMDQRYMGAKGQIENGNPACIKKWASMSSYLIGRTAIGERVWDIHRLIDIIERYLSKYIDIKKIICMGNSGGGTATFYASCFDKRIAVSIPSCAVCTYDDSIVAMKHCPCNYVPNIRKYFNMGDLGCLIAPRPVVVVCGVEDKIFPLHGVEKSVSIMKKAYESVGKGELCQLVKGNGGHQFYPDEAWPVVKKIM